MLRRSRAAAAAAIGTALLAGTDCKNRSPPPLALAPRSEARVLTVALPSRSPHAYARPGDLRLTSGRAAVTVAAAPDAPGHQPLRGAIVDASFDGTDRPDPLLWWRPGWLEASGHLHPIIARAVAVTHCEDGSPGIETSGEAAGVELVSVLCPTGPGTFRLTTTPRSPLPAGAHLSDELHPGTAPAVVARAGFDWDGALDTPYIVFAEHGTALVVEAEPAPIAASRQRTRIAGEVFPSPIRLTFSSVPAVRTMRVLEGDALDALGALGSASRWVTLAPATAFSGSGASAPEIAAAEARILDASGRLLAQGLLDPYRARTLRLPPDLGELLEVRDGRGLVVVPRRPLPSPGETALARASDEPAAGAVEVHYVDEHGAPLAVHVLFKGLDGTPDPEPRVASDRIVAAGRSLYLLDGSARVALAPGRYRVTASHGPAYGLSTRVIEIGNAGWPHEADGGGHSPSPAAPLVTIDDRLPRIVDTSEWTSGDFHLHAAPSPDAPVSLRDRVISLVCEGLELGAATDHNRITDYRPAIEKLRVGGTFVAISGDEITSGGAVRWGHFNAFPLDPAPPSLAPEDAVPEYDDVPPGELLAAARARGARILQVNHGRMQPGIGYFDRVGLDPATGEASPDFSANFDAVEAYNGIWLESPDKVREGVRDLVALARRGLRAAATGNSDSHRLLFEEAGYPRTFVHAPAAPIDGRAERAIAALLAGDTTVTSGPFVEFSVEGARPGAIVRVPAGSLVHAHVRVRAPAWVPVESVEIWVDDRAIERFAVAGPAVDGVRFERDVTLSLTHDAVALAYVEAETPLPDVVPLAHARAIGFTGLVYLDADGDGEVTAAAGR